MPSETLFCFCYDFVKMLPHCILKCEIQDDSQPLGDILYSNSWIYNVSEFTS